MRIGAAWVLCLIVFSLSACGGGGGGGSDGGGDLVVMSFSHDARQDVYRDQLLSFELSAPIARSSLDSRAVKLLGGPRLQTPVECALLLGGDYGLPGRRNHLFIDPTRTQAHVARHSKKTPLDEITQDRAFGLAALESFRVVFEGPGEGTELRARGGRSILSGAEYQFGSGDRYTPEEDQPSFFGIDGSGELGFAPQPADGEPVAFDARILIEFDEPIHPATMEVGRTVFVRNLDVLDYLERPIQIPGNVSASDDGRVYEFQPSFHYGTGPYRIEVELTTDIEDRSGNSLDKGVTRVFVTEENPDVDTIDSVIETFDTNAYEDTPATDAEWNSVAPGRVRGGEITTTVVTVAYQPVAGISANILVDYPLVSDTTSNACPNAWQDGARVMMSYTGSDIGVAGAITEIYWGPASNALFAATHDNIQIRIGIAKNSNGSLGKKFDDNWRDGKPLAAYDGKYTLPQDADVNTAPGTNTAVANHWSWPKLTVPFEYDGTSALIVDIATDAAPDCQTLRTWFHGTGPAGVGYPGIRALVGDTKTASQHFSQDASYPDGYPMVYDAAFVIRRRLTAAQSLFYDTARANPTYADPILSPVEQQGGATFTLEWQGAHGISDQNDPEKVIPNPLDVTTWSTDASIADGRRFIRFRIRMVANLNSDTVPEISRIQLPFSFKKE
jgi:hypothetical protein